MGGMHVSTKQLAIFKIDSDEYGIWIEHISSIEQMLEIFKIPNSPDYVEGMVNLRGNVYSVVNLRKRFGMHCPEFNENNKIIMVKSSASISGIIVDFVREIIKVEDSNFNAEAKPKSGLENKFICGNAVIGNRTIMLLDLEKVLA